MMWLIERLKIEQKETASDKVLRDKAFNIVKNSKSDGYQRGLASTVYKFFNEKTFCCGVATLANKSAANNKIKQNQQLAEELHKLIINKF